MLLDIGDDMRIRSVHISNLRAISDATIELDDYSCFVGTNGAGKSTVLFALNVFFREPDAQGNPMTALSLEDFHKRDTSKPVKITVWFDQLTPEAREDFKDYFRNDQLVVTAEAVFDEARGKAEIKQYGQRLAMAAFADFFKRKSDGAKVGELKELYAKLLSKFSDLGPAGTGPAMEEALRKFETARPEQCALIPSEDQFYGATKGQGRLQRHIQWVHVPAVKDASTEQAEGKSTALGKLLARTVRAKVNFSEGLSQLTREARASYQRLLDESQSQLAEVSSALNARLTQWAHPDASLRLQWHQDSERSIRVEDPFAKVLAGEGEFEGELARFGHGFQRSYLLALLQELASFEAGSGGPRLILGCEEPELYQHPPQARHLASVLQELAKSGSQVLVSTHSPLFVAGDSFESVRLVRRDPVSKTSSVRKPSLDEIGLQVARALGEQPAKDPATLSRIYQLLQPQLAEMFFTQRLVLVEGIEDCAYVHAWLAMTDRLLDFRKRGVHLVPVGGKSELLRPAIIARHMEIPLFVVFDADGDKIEKDAHRQSHERDNRSLLRFLNGDASQLFPDEPIWGRDHAIWPKELSDCVEGDLKASLGDVGFEAVKNNAQVRCGHAGGARKHTMMVGAKLAFAREAGAESATLDRLCEHLLAF
jgi:putative ATP-dependent endonuclease of the OLD family